jgi:hypothetical protein
MLYNNSMTDLNVDKLTPPPELVQQWAHMLEQHTDTKVFTAAARWGADQELEACCEWANATGWEGAGDSLRAARRPKLPSLKEQALEALNRQERGRDRGSLRPQAMADADIIRRALEALPND